MKYHIVNGEAKLCNAQIRECPIGGEHFKRPEDAYDKLYGGRVPKALKGNQNFIKEHSKTFKITATIGLAATIVAAGGAAAYGVGHQSTNEVNKTPYSVSISVPINTDQGFSGYVVNSNLSHSNFSNCATQHQEVTDHITCKTVDGKFTVTGISHPKYQTNEGGQKRIVEGQPSSYVIKNTLGPVAYSSNNIDNIKLKDNSTGISHQLTYHGISNSNMNNLYISQKNLN